MAKRFVSMEDRSLILRSCGGDREALDILHDRHQPSLLLAIKSRLGQHAGLGYTAEDIAQEVWLSLLAREQRQLRQYDPARGSFAGYLRMLAASQIRHLRRAERCRQVRALPLERYELPDPGSDAALVQAEFAEYVEHLTPQERHYLMAQGVGETTGSPSLSGGNQRVLKYRLQHKWLQYLNHP